MASKRESNEEPKAIVIQQTSLKKIKIDPDQNCRLRNGLNTDCLITIFQYLGTEDLLRLSGMNEYYKELINDFIITSHQVVFDMKSGPPIEEIFEMFENKIRSFRFYGDVFHFSLFVQQMFQHFSEDQLNSVEFEIIKNQQYSDDKLDKLINEMPLWDAARELKSFTFKAYARFEHEYIYPFEDWLFPHTLRVLKLENIRYTKDPCKCNLQFIKTEDEHWRPACKCVWKALENVKELHLNNVVGIEDSEWCCFMSRRPRLEKVFIKRTIKDMALFGSHLACHCSEYIRVLHQSFDGVYPTNYSVFRTQRIFLKHLNNLHEASLDSKFNCAHDLSIPICALQRAINLKKLTIHHNGREWHRCNGVIKTDYNKQLVQKNYFRNLKSIEIHFHGTAFACRHHHLFIEWPQIMSNVETVTVAGQLTDANPLNLIKIVPKLRQLSIYNSNLQQMTQALDLIRIIQTLLEQRKCAEGDADKNKPMDLVGMIVNHDQLNLFQRANYPNLDNFVRFKLRERDML